MTVYEQVIRRWADLGFPSSIHVHPDTYSCLLDESSQHIDVACSRPVEPLFNLSLIVNKDGFKSQ